MVVKMESDIDKQNACREKVDDQEKDKIWFISLPSYKKIKAYADYQNESGIVSSNIHYIFGLLSSSDIHKY